jgi:acetyl esterase/lipase
LKIYLTEQIKIDLYYPENIHDFTTIVWFHSGGLYQGEKYIPKELKNQGIAIVAVNYRLNPKVNCPEYIEDAAASTAWIFGHIEKYGGSADKIVVSGASAGGYLTLMIGLDKHYLESFEVDANKIAMLIPLSGHTISHATIRQEQGISEERVVVDEYAPLWHVHSDAPPLFLITGDRELEFLGRYEENAYMWRMMKIAGPNDCHLFELDGFNHSEMGKPGLKLLLNIINKRMN